MKKAQLKRVVQKKYVVHTTDSNHIYPVADNHLNGEFSPARSAKAWVSDLDLHVREHRVHLCPYTTGLAILDNRNGFIRQKNHWLGGPQMRLDLRSMSLISGPLSESMKASDTSIPAWKMAVKNRPVEGNMIFHSHRGVQHGCNAFTNELKTYPQVLQTMSRKGNGSQSGLGLRSVGTMPLPRASSKL
jgi:hypothetical protein